VHAVVIVDGELVVEERPDPVPGDTELLVDVRSAGLNGADLVQRRGGYPAPPGFPPDIPGLEFAGEVRAVGRSVTRFAPGDAVMALVGGGGQSSVATVDEAHALAVPAGVDWEQAGGFPEAFATAYDALFTQCALAPGERALVTGAAGGVGSAGVQLAAAAGATVVASVRDPTHHAALTELGAAVAVSPDDVGDHGPYDVVLELVGAASFPTALGSLATGGRISVIGVGSGAVVEVNLMVLMGRRARLSASMLRARNRTDKAVVVDGVRAHVVPLLAAGRVRVPVTDTFPLAEVSNAYDRFAAGHKLGKIVLLA